MFQYWIIESEKAAKSKDSIYTNVQVYDYQADKIWKKLT